MSEAGLGDTERVIWLRLARTEGLGAVGFARLIARYETAEAALDAFTAADTFRTGTLSSRDFCGMLGRLYAAAGAAPLSPGRKASDAEEEVTAKP